MASSLNGTGISFSDGTSQSTAGTLSNAASGYMKLPNGMIIQWGQSALTTGSNGTGAYLTTAFPITFPNAIRQVVSATYGPTELNCALSNNIISWTTSNFVVCSMRQAGGNPRAYSPFIAIGY